jgi:hypothetical protein
MHPAHWSGRNESAEALSLPAERKGWRVQLSSSGGQDKDGDELMWHLPELDLGPRVDEADEAFPCRKGRSLADKGARSIRDVVGLALWMVMEIHLVVQHTRRKQPPIKGTTRFASDVHMKTATVVVWS